MPINNLNLNFEFKKEAFTIPDADRIVDQVITSESSYDILKLFHIGTNNFESVSPDICANKISDIFRNLQESGSNAMSPAVQVNKDIS